MNKYEIEADIAYFESCIDEIEKTHNGNIAEFMISRQLCERVISALEKRMPKKPNKAIDRTWGIEKEVNVCPVCDSYLAEVHFIELKKTEHNKKVTYCETCGQAIDWNIE